jgi:hypothetical protein
MQHFSAFDESWLDEDPIIPRDYYVYRDGHVSRSFPLEEIDYFPLTERAAVETAVWILQQVYRDVEITEVDFEKESRLYSVRVELNYYEADPFYGGEPVRGLVFTVVCRDGKWSISEPQEWDG